MGGPNGTQDAQYIAIEELLRRIDATMDGMSMGNPNRLLLQQCRVAIVYLAERVPDERLRQQIVRP